jgi:hypothetical protein
MTVLYKNNQRKEVDESAVATLVSQGWVVAGDSPITAQLKPRAVKKPEFEPDMDDSTINIEKE